MARADSRQQGYGPRRRAARRDAPDAVVADAVVAVVVRLALCAADAAVKPAVGAGSDALRVDGRETVALEARVVALAWGQKVRLEALVRICGFSREPTSSAWRKSGTGAASRYAPAITLPCPSNWEQGKRP